MATGAAQPRTFTWRGKSFDPRDIRFFFNGELWFVGIATAMMAVLELGLIPKAWPLADWARDWKALLALAAVSVMIVFPAIARGRQHLKTRKGYLRRSGAESFALESLQGRAAHLISKVRQIEQGETTKEYLAHTVTACQTYFRGRLFSGDKEVDGRKAKIDVVYYKRNDKSQTQMYEKQKVSDGSSARFKSTVSSRQGETARGVLSDVNAARTLSTQDFGIWGDVWLDATDPYVVGVGVPVLSGPKDSAETIGLLIAVASLDEALHESDHEYLAAVGWLIAASCAVESLPIDPRNRRGGSHGVGMSVDTVTVSRGE